MTSKHRQQMTGRVLGCVLLFRVVLILSGASPAGAITLAFDPAHSVLRSPGFDHRPGSSADLSGVQGSLELSELTPTFHIGEAALILSGYGANAYFPDAYSIPDLNTVVALFATSLSFSLTVIEDRFVMPPILLPSFTTGLYHMQVDSDVEPPSDLYDFSHHLDHDPLVLDWLLPAATEFPVIHREAGPGSAIVGVQVPVDWAVLATDTHPSYGFTVYTAFEFSGVLSFGVVPEPGTALLVGICLGGLALRRNGAPD